MQICQSITLKKKLVAVARKDSHVIEVLPGIIKGLFFFSWFCICFESDILGMFCSPCNTAACCKYPVNSCGIFIATTMQLNRVVRCRSKVSPLKIRLRAQSSKRHQRELRATIHHPCIFSIPFLKNSESVHFVLVPCSDRPWMSSFHHAPFSGAY